MDKACISCGMPLNKPEDHAKGDEGKDYCLHCARSDGTLKSYDEALERMTRYTMDTESLAEAAAKESAKKSMAKMPAGKDH
jgi:hypothetical protein